MKSSENNMKLERAVIEIFGGCNYSCGMCPQSSGRGQDFNKKMPLDLFEGILDEIIENHGTPNINLEGSGEPTLAKDLPKYVEACTRRGLRSYMTTNGSRMTGKFMRDVIDAGLSFVRFSFIGYNADLYKKWMSKDNFYQVIRHAKETRDYINETNSTCELFSYHLILDPAQKDFEIKEYQNNFIDPVGSTGYIWMMHNWSGNVTPEYSRNSKPKRSCGRPFAPVLTVRAGGLNGKHAAVTPCTQTMGPPNEAKSVLGHLEDQSIQGVLEGPPYQELRQKHSNNDFDSIDYCRNCDFLIEDPEVLVWSNDPNATTETLIGTHVSLQKHKPK